MTQDLTVLVIGAGANADFRLKKRDEKELIAMPTGEQLVEKIADWEKEVLPNLVYGYLLDKAQELKFTDFISVLENVSHFLIKGEIQWRSNHWVKQFLPENDKGTGSYQQKKKFLVEIGWNIEVSTFNKNWTYNKIEDSENFSWYHKISDIVKHYQPFSIDEMLDSIKIGKVNLSKWTGKTENDKNEKEKLIQAGKDLIALFLLRSEDKKVFDYDTICWYRHLRNAVITCGKNKEEVEEKLKNFVIISFNYDRSLDYFLRTRVGEFYEKIKVIYPYGSLSEKEIWKSENYEKIGYGAAKNQTNFETKWENFEKAKMLAQDLKVIGELEESAKEIIGIRDIKKVMAGSKKLYFLGFAFHEANCRDLMGMEDREFKKLCNELRSKTNPQVFFTNFGESMKIKKLFDFFFQYHDSQSFAQSSKKGTYDALSQDFDFKI